MRGTDWSGIKTNEGVSSDEDPYDSDTIGSDVEAELYSVLHYQHETSTIDPRQSCSSVNNSDHKNKSKHKETCINSDQEQISVTNFNHQTPNSSQVINNLKNNNKEQISNNFLSDIVLDSDLFKSFDSPKRETSKIHEVDDPKSKSCPKKRKSDSLQKLQTDPKKQKTSSSTSTRITSKYNDSIIIDSSDEDIIWMDSTETKNSFQTNLSQNHSLDLDSESNDSWCFKFSNDTPLTSKSLQDPWLINNEDFYRARRSVGRYHESKSLICNNCNQNGHTARFCSTTEVKRCHICGMPHRANNCKRRICPKCHRTGHDMKYCGYAILECYKCGMTGHSEQLCPDLWRKYQLTTANKFIQVERLLQETPMYCYNCGQEGHFGGDCREDRMRATFFHTWPMVLDLPHEKIDHNTLRSTATKTETSNSYRQHNIEKRELSFMDRFIASKNLPSKRKKKKKKKNLKISSNPENTREAQPFSFQRTPKKQQPQHIGVVLGPTKKSKKKKNERKSLKKFKWISPKKNF